MVKVLCDAKNTLKLSELIAFQGDLKKRTTKDIKTLASSISTEGLIMPFAVWPSPSGYKLLDGHGRLAALTELALTDNTVTEQPFPVIYITADTEEQAKQLLLQITSSYGRITREGALKFCATIPEYKAPSINKYVHRPIKKIKAKDNVKNNNEVILRIAVPAAYEKSVRDLFASTDYIKVL